MKLGGLSQSFFLTIVGIGIGIFVGIYLGVVCDEFFNICPFRGGIDCINYLAPFPAIGALLGPFLIFIARNFLRGRRKRSS